MRSRKFLVGGAVIALSLWFLIPLLTGPNATRTAQKLGSNMKGQDWGAIYDMSPELEKSKHRWGRKEYVNLMNIIARKNLMELKGMDVSESSTGTPTWKAFYLSFEATKADGSKELVRIMVPVWRDRENWKPTVAQIPIHMHNLRRRPTRESLRFFVDACREAGVDAFARIDDNLELSVDRLDGYLKGTVSWQDTYVHQRVTEDQN